MFLMFFGLDFYYISVIKCYKMYDFLYLKIYKFFNIVKLKWIFVWWVILLVFVINLL